MLVVASIHMPLGKRTDCGDAKYVGVEVPFCCDVVETLQVRRLHASRKQEARQRHHRVVAIIEAPTPPPPDPVANRSTGQACSGS